MDLRHWIRDNYEDARGIIQATGWKSHVLPSDMEDFTSRVMLRVLDVEVENPAAFIATVARRQAVDDTRLRLKRPHTVPLAEDRVGDAQERLLAWTDPYGELEVLDQVKRLGRGDARALLGHALGMYDRELAEDGQTLHAVTKRRSRARERMAA